MSSSSRLLVGVAFLLLPTAAFSQEPIAKLDRHGDPLPKGAIERYGSPRLRHPYVRTFRLSPDRRTLYTLGFYSDLVAWDVASGKKIRTFGSTDNGGKLAISRDGTLLATWYSEGPVEFWDALQGKKVRTWKGDFFGFDPEDTLSPRGELRVREMSKNPDWPLDPEAKRRGYLSPDRAYMMVRLTESPPSLEIFDMAKKTRIALLSPDDAKGNERGLVETAFTPDSKTFILAWASGISLYDLSQRRQRAMLPAKDAHFVSMSTNGKRLAAALGDGTVVLFDVDSAKEIRRWQAGCHGWSQVGFSRDGSLLATTAGPSIRFWNPEIGERVDPFRDGGDEILSIRYSPDGKSLAVESWQKLRIYDAAPLRMRVVLEREYDYHNACSLLFSPDSRLLHFAVSNFEGEMIGRLMTSVGELDLATGKDRLIFRKQETPISFGHVKQKLQIAVQNEDDISLIDAASNRESARFSSLVFRPGHDTKFMVSPNTTLIACFDRRRAFFLAREASPNGAPDFALPNGIKISVDSSSHPDEKAVTLPSGFSDDGRSFVAVTKDPSGSPDPIEIGIEEILMWDTATGRIRARIKAEPKKWNAFALSSNGRFLATAAGNVIRILDPALGDELARFEAHDTVIVALALSPDNKKLVSGGADGTLTMWDLAPAFAAKADRLDGDRLKALWNDLDGSDGMVSHRAIGEMVRHPAEALAFLCTRLPHGPAADPKTTAKLIADLNHADFAVREQATRVLAGLGHAARPVLRSAVQDSPSPEAKARLNGLLNKLDNETTGAGRLRFLRALEVLDRIGTAESRDALRDVEAFGPSSIAEEAARCLAR